VRLTARPCRVAFIVELAKVSSDELDELARFSTGLWGGRQHLLLASSDGALAPREWQLAHLYDPDYLFLVHAVSEETVAQLRWRLDPLEIISADHRSRLDGRLRLGRAALDLQSLRGMAAFAAAHASDFRAPVFVDLQDGPADTGDARVLLRNFGVRSRDYLSDREYADVDAVPFDLAKTAATDFLMAIHPSEIAKTLGLAGSGGRLPARAIVPTSLAGFCCPRSNSFDDRRHAEDYEIVVGDDPRDQIYAWNRFLLSEGREQDTFWLPDSLRSEEPFLAALGQWINGTFHRSDRRALCVSHSMDEADLVSMATAMTRLSRIPFGAASLARDPAALPLMTALGSWMFVSRPILDLPDPTEATLSSPEDGGLLSIPTPPFLARGLQRSSWMVRATIGDAHLERLPRRPGVGALFVDGGRARIEGDGRLAVKVNSESRNNLFLKLPDNESLIRACFNNSHLEYIWETRRGLYLQPSQAGVALNGLLDVAGGLTAAARLLAPGFWREQLNEMSGRPRAVLASKVEQIRAALAEGATAAAVPEMSEAQLDVIAERIADVVSLQFPEPRRFDAKGIRDSLQRFLGTSGAPPDERAHYLDGLKYTLDDLVERNILRHGASTKCRQCGSRRWLPIEDLRASIRCGGCGRSFSLPAVLEWQFALNELVASAVRAQGSVAVVMALDQMRRGRYSDRFLWLTSQDVIDAKADRVTAELDVLAVHDGRFLIGEVKSNAIHITAEDLRSLASVAKLIRPDCVVVAAPRPWPPATVAHVGDLRSTLAPAGVDVQRLVLPA
jgi:hypothetical protein